MVENGRPDRCPSYSATLCWRLWRCLRDQHEIKAVGDGLRADLHALDADLRTVSGRARACRQALDPPADAVPIRPWTASATASATALLVALRCDPNRFADVLVEAGLDDDLLDTFVYDVMGDDDPSDVVACVYERDADAGRRLARAVLSRAPVRHLDGVVQDLVGTGLDLFDESSPETVAFVAGACRRIIEATLGARLPIGVARLAASLDPFQVVFVDWIGAALKRPRPGLRPHALVNLIVVADNLAALIRSSTQVADRWRDDLAAFARNLLYAAAGDRGRREDDGAERLWTVSVADMARLARAAGVTDVPDGVGYAVLRRPVPDGVDDDDERPGVRALIAYLVRRSDLVALPHASLYQQLQATDQAPGVADRVLDVLHRTTPPVLARDDFRPLLETLLERYEEGAASATAVARLGRQLMAGRRLLRLRGEAVADAETTATAAPILDAIRPRTERFVADMRHGTVAPACGGIADGALVCGPCRGAVLDRARVQARFAQNALAAVRRRFGADDAVAERVCASIASALAVAIPVAPCEALGRALDRIAGAHPDLAGFRMAFGGPVGIDAMEESVFDEAASVLGQVGNGIGDDWTKITRAYAIVSEAVQLGKPTNANVAADIIAVLAYVVFRGRARRLGAVLTVLGEQMCGSPIYMHISVAVNALLTLFNVGKLDGVTAIPGAPAKVDSAIEA